MARPQNKEEYRKELAETFANILEEKGLNWKKEWRAVGADEAPRNAVTGHVYNGTNCFYLSLMAYCRGYNDPRWATMIQIMDNDKKYHPGEKWHLKAGTKAVYVEYWYPYDLVKNKALTWSQYKDEIDNGRAPKEFRLSTKYTAVFNASQIEGIRPLPEKEKFTVPIDELVNTLSHNMNVPVFYDGGDRAYYSPSKDEIHLPAPENFTSEYALNATALHELAHSTGHSTRLNRDIENTFGSESYAYEELVAEITSCFMGVNLETDSTDANIDNHKAYVQSWVREIRDKPEKLVHAIKDAQAATTYMEEKAEIITPEESKKRNSEVMEVTADGKVKEAENASRTASRCRGVR